MIINQTGGGSNILNLTILGGTTQPTSPKDGTIWVNTAETITDWVFSSTQPTTRTDGSPLSGGEVWFKCGTSSPAAQNILKKNGAFEYPIACMQYVSGAWAAKTAKTRQNGAWVDWVTPLYKNGNEYTELTGGWVGSPNWSSAIPGGDNLTSPTVTRNANNIVMSWYTYGDTSRQYPSPTLFTANKIDLTDKRQLRVSGSYQFADPVSDYTGTCLGVSNSKANGYTMAACNKRTDGSSSGTLSDIAIDISSLVGLYYIALNIRGHWGGGNLTITDVYLV